MKRLAREKNSIVIGFAFYLILTVFVFLFFTLNTLGDLKSVETLKDDTKKIYDEKVEVEKSGLSFNEFKTIAASSYLGKDSQGILDNITSEFYDQNLKNETQDSFELFIKSKDKELNSDENTELITNNEKQIVNILPTYSEENIDIEGNMSDYQFINYVESIMESFNLTTNGSIGIGRVVLLEDYAISSKKGENQDSNIYSIPLNINLSGTKANIVDFLYFIEKVGTISIENNKVAINNDSGFLAKNGFPKVLVGDTYSKDYNIFEHQIADIDSISMTKYIDSSYKSRNDLDFIDFIKSEQGDDEFEVKLNLLFYVKGLPKYKVLEFINTVLDNYKLVNARTNADMSKGEVKGVALLNLKKRQTLLKNLNTKIINLNKDLRGQKDLESVYQGAIEINEFIEPICEELDSVCK